MMDSVILSNIAPFGYRKVGEREYRTLVVEDKMQRFTVYL